MKKHLLIAVLFGSMAFSATAQNAKEDQKNSKPKPTHFSDLSTKRESTPVNPSPLACDSLTSTFVGGNGQDGNMFDVTALQTVTITQFSQNVDGSGVFKIYYRTGSFVGYDTLSTGWIFVDSAAVTSAGIGVPTLLPINVNLTVPKDSTVAFYITGADGLATVDYTNGTAVGNVYVSDSSLQIKEGHGGQYPFSVTYNPRVWNGIIHYCSGTTGIETALTSSNDLRLSPNPISNSGVFTFSNPEKYLGVTFELYDALGKKQVVSKVTSQAFTVEKAGLAAGLYSYKFFSEDKVLSSGKLIIE